MPLVVPPTTGLALLLVAAVLAACLRARHRPGITINRDAHQRASAEWAAYRRSPAVDEKEVL